MRLPIYQVDAFTDHLFGGNPAAVCPLEQWLETATMQSIAAENNLAETAFFVANGSGFDLRWFTPALEVDLCGHATLATAHILFEHLGYKSNRIIFFTRSGELIVERVGDAYRMDFPSQPPVTDGVPADLIPALEISGAQYVGQSVNYYFVALADQQAVEQTSPDMRALAKLEKIGVIVSAPGDEVDFVSRFFAPKAGIDEDPVTGSAHCALIPYWAERLGKHNLSAWQISPRKGVLACELVDDRVWIGGKAVTYLEGQIYV
ncbi:MAG: PhzF family phenazine biosynthesis protein [Bacteroidota bacterium]